MQVWIQTPYQSDEQDFHVDSQAFPGSFVWPKHSSSVHWERGSPPSDQHVWWQPAGAAHPVGQGCWTDDKEVKTLPSNECPEM
jgi:hypothetical protein